MKISRAAFVAKLPAESAALRVEPADLSVTLENVKFLSFREPNGINRRSYQSYRQK